MKRRRRGGFGDAQLPDLSLAQAAALDLPLTPAQCARMLQVSRMTLRRRVDDGQIPARKLGRQTRFIPSEVLQALKNGPKKPAGA